MPPHAPPTPLFYLLLVLIILPILYVRLRRAMKPQRLKLNQLWIRPALYIVITGLVVLAPQPGAQPLMAGDAIWFVLAALLGMVGGWQMGRVTAIHVDPEKGTLMATGGQAAMIIIVLLVAVRLGVRTGLDLEASAWHLNVAVITDASIVFAGFLFAARGLEMYLRAQRVMKAHEATKA
jgi:hypothetical protein